MYHKIICYLPCTAVSLNQTKEQGRQDKITTVSTTEDPEPVRSNALARGEPIARTSVLIFPSPPEAKASRIIGFIKVPMLDHRTVCR